jgi:hypothetical protein
MWMVVLLRYEHCFVTIMRGEIDSSFSRFDGLVGMGDFSPATNPHMMG